MRQSAKQVNQQSCHRWNQSTQQIEIPSPFTAAFSYGGRPATQVQAILRPLQPLNHQGSLGMSDKGIGMAAYCRKGYCSQSTYASIERAPAPRTLSGPGFSCSTKYLLHYRHGKLCQATGGCRRHANMHCLTPWLNAHLLTGPGYGHSHKIALRLCQHTAMYN